MERLTVLAWFVSHTVPTGSANRYDNMESPAIRQEKYLVRTVRRIKSDNILLSVPLLDYVRTHFLCALEGNFVGLRFHSRYLYPLLLRIVKFNYANRIGIVKFSIDVG